MANYKPENRKICQLLLAVYITFAATGSGAENSSAAAIVPLPSILDFTDGEGWGVALGAGIEYDTAYDGADEYELGIDPAVAVQYRDGDNLFFWEGVELGWRGLLSRQVLLQAGARYEGGLEPDDSEDGNLDGIAARDSHIVGFLEGRYGLRSDWRNWLGGRLMGGDSDFGWLGVVAAGHRFGDSYDGTGTEVILFSTFGNSTFINKDFGVTAEDAENSTLPETTLGGGYRSTGLTLIHRVDITQRIQLLLEAGLEYYSSEIQDSPIARRDYEIETGLSAVYQF